MVKPAVDEFQRKNFPFEYLAQNRKRAEFRPLPVAAEPTISKAEEIACTFEIHVRLEHHGFVAMLSKPAFEMRLFALPLGMAKAAGHGPAADHYAGVGSEHQVRESWNRRHTLKHGAQVAFKHLH